MHLVPTLCWVMKVKEHSCPHKLQVQLERRACSWLTSPSAKGAKTKCYGTEKRERRILMLDMEIQQRSHRKIRTECHEEKGKKGGNEGNSVAQALEILLFLWRT